MPRRSLLGSAQRAALLALPELDDLALARHYTLGRRELALVRERRKDRNRLGVAVLALFVQHQGRFPDPDEVLPTHLLAFVAEQLGVVPAEFDRYARRDETRREHQGEIARAFGYVPFTTSHYRGFERWLRPLARAAPAGLPLVEALIAELRRVLVLLPPVATLERLAAYALTRAQHEAFTLLTEKLTPEVRAKLDELLVVPAGEQRTKLAWLRAGGGAASPSTVLALTERLAFVRALGLNVDDARAVHPNRLRQLAREGAQITPQHFADFEPTRRYAVLVATLHDRRETLTDEALELHDRFFLGLGRKTRAQQDAQLVAVGPALRDKTRLYGQVGKAVIDAHEQQRDVIKAIEAVLAWPEFVATVEEALTLGAPKQADALHLLRLHYAQVRRYAPTFLDTFAFTGVRSCRTLLRAVQILRELNADGKRNVPSGAPIDFVPQRWAPYVIDGDKLDRHDYELCVLSELRGRLRAGDVWVVGSRRYRDFDAHLLPKDNWKPEPNGPLALAVPDDFRPYWNTLEAQLQGEFGAVNDLLKRKELPDVRLDAGRLHVAALTAGVPKEAEVFADRLYALVPRVKITRLLLDVADWTGFDRAFTHLRDDTPPDDPLGVLTVVLADAINLGVTGMATAAPGYSERQLAWLAEWYLRDDTYRSALAAIVNFQTRLPLAQLWGDGTTSSSGGQRYKMGAQGKASGMVNARYGNEPGVTFYTHLGVESHPLPRQGHRDECTRRHARARRAAVSRNRPRHRRALHRYPRLCRPCVRHDAAAGLSLRAAHS